MEFDLFFLIVFIKIIVRINLTHFGCFFKQVFNFIFCVCRGEFVIDKNTAYPNSLVADIIKFLGYPFRFFLFPVFHKEIDGTNFRVLKAF